MKRTFSYLVFLVLLIVIIAFGYQAVREEEVVETEEPAASTLTPPEKPKVFASDRLGVSFSYPGTWGMEPAEDSGSLFLGVDANCTQDCQGITLEVITKENQAYQYENRLTHFSQNDLRVVKAPPVIGGEGRSNNEMEIYNKKDTIYVFRATPGIESVFDQIIEDFQEIPRVTAVKTPSTDQRDFKFDSCGNLDTYAAEPFSADLLQKLGTLQRYLQPAFVSLKGTTKIKKEDISDACHSQAGNIVIMLAKGNEYCERGVIIKYETDTGSIALADFSPSMETLGRCGSLQNFGKRSGRFIETRAATGDAGVGVKWDLRYDYIENALYPKRICVETHDETNSTAPPKIECKDF